MTEPPQKPHDSRPPSPASGPESLSSLAPEAERLLDRVRELYHARPEREGHVASGGMAVVDAVRDPSLGRRSAMKVIRRELGSEESTLGLFIREAHVTGQLEHPNIVPVHELGIRADGRPYFTMKLVEGRTLEEEVDALPEGPLSFSGLFPLLGVVNRVCEALAFAHSRGVVHCDVKPSNVMLGDFGQVYLMDWGIARLRARTDADAESVSSWVQLPPKAGVSGSPQFMSPEQAGGEGTDERTDVFGVGGLLYHIVVRRGPFTGASAAETYAMAMIGEIAPLSEVAPWAPRELRRIIERALEPEAEDRYPSIVALQEHLVRFMRGGGDFPVVRFDAGEHVVREGEEADAAYVILSGRCEVYTGAGEHRHVWKVLETDEVFGETAILAASERTASVVALESSRLMKISREDFQQEIDAMKPWMGAFARSLASRFRELLLDQVAHD